MVLPKGIFPKTDKLFDTKKNDSSDFIFRFFCFGMEANDRQIYKHFSSAVWLLRALLVAILFYEGTSRVVSFLYEQIWDIAWYAMEYVVDRTAMGVPK